MFFVEYVNSLDHRSDILFDRAVCGVGCKTSVGCALRRSFIADGQVTWGSPLLLRLYGVLCVKWY